MADSSCDVVVIGAGISGATSAFEIALSGLRVVLIDRYAPAAMASGCTVAGVRQSGRHPAELPLAIRVVKLWAPIIASVETCAVPGMRGRPPWHAIQKAAPALSGAIVLASLCPTDGQVDPKAGVAAFVRAAERAGAVLRFDERVTAIETQAGRVQAVVTDTPTARPTMQSAHHALGVFRALVPAFRTARIESIWAGLIDQTPDPLPVLDATTAVEGPSIAMGFSGHAFCLGPLTGQIMRDFVHKTPPAVPLDAFKLARFEGWNGPTQPLTLHG